ncbi:hypothetical protein EI94DRAFT_1800747 [Lactarius quietus]|nr:hypothetical protein EI94DRAFT_1800747 [Lactarius quietus]
MPCITEDPTQATCPSFEDPGWGFLRQSMIAAHQGDQPLMDDKAAQQLKDTWASENELKIIAWNAQKEQDQLERDEQDRLAQEDEAILRAQKEREAEEQRAEAEERKPKPSPLDFEPASYALGKIHTWEYIKLDYFTAKGCREAVEANRSTSHDTLALTQLGGTIAIGPLAAKPSRHVRMDEELSWEEMFNTKNVLLHFMDKSGVWPIAHSECVANFFFNLKVHPRKLQTNGKKALIVYQAWAHHEWFDALQRKQGFNLAIIQEELLCSIAEEVNEGIRTREMSR